MKTATRRIWIRLVDERGASMVEYALLLALVALVIVAGATLLGSALGTRYGEFGTAVQDAGTP